MFNSYMSHYVIVNLTNSEIEKEIKLIRVLLLDHTTINQVGIKNNLAHSLWKLLLPVTWFIKTPSFLQNEHCDDDLSYQKALSLVLTSDLLMLISHLPWLAHKLLMLMFMLCLPRKIGPGFSAHSFNFFLLGKISSRYVLVINMVKVK